MATIQKINSETRKIIRALKTPNTKPHTLTGIPASTVYLYLKTGKIAPERELELKKALNRLYIELGEFLRLEIAPTEKYFLSFLDLTANKAINVKGIYDLINQPKPNYSLLLVSYWGSNYAKAKKLQIKESIISEYLPFFQAFKKEIKNIQSKIKV